MCPEFSLGPKPNKGRSVSNNVAGAISRGTDSCSVGHAGLWDEAASRTHVPLSPLPPPPPAPRAQPHQGRLCISSDARQRLSWFQPASSRKKANRPAVVARDSGARRPKGKGQGSSAGQGHVKDAAVSWLTASGSLISYGHSGPAADGGHGEGRQDTWWKAEQGPRPCGQLVPPAHAQGPASGHKVTGSTSCLPYKDVIVGSGGGRDRVLSPSDG